MSLGILEGSNGINLLKFIVYGSYIHQFTLKIHLVDATRRGIWKFDNLDDENYAENVKC